MNEEEGVMWISISYAWEGEGWEITEQEGEGWEVIGLNKVNKTHRFLP